MDMSWLYTLKTILKWVDVVISNIPYTLGTIAAAFLKPPLRVKSEMKSTTKTCRVRARTTTIMKARERFRANYDD